MTKQRNVRRNLVAWAACLAGLAVCPRVHAGPVEQLVEVATPPGTSQTMVVRYINGGGGLLLSTDGARSWKLQCNSAFLMGGGRVPGPTVILADGTLLLVTSQGVMKSGTDGCGIAPEQPELTKTVVDLVLDPSDPMRAYGVTSNPMGQSSVVQRNASGEWSELGVKDAPSPLGLRVAKRELGLRFYELVVKSAPMDAGGGSMSAPTYALRVSDDQAMTWQEYPLMLDSGRPRLRGVDPSNADRLLIGIERSMAPDTVLVTRDGGKTLEKYLDIEEPGGVAFAPDGRVWIGDLGGTSGGTSSTRGLYAAPNLDTPPTRLPMSMYPVQCVNYAPDTDTVYACQRFWFGSVDKQTGEFKIMVRFTDVPEFVSCPGADTAEQCKTQLCLDYCGPAHFAVAPVCSAYDEPACGKPVALAEATENGSGSGVSGSPAPGSAGNSADAGRSAPTPSAGGSTGAAGASTPSGGRSNTPAKGAGGGCSVRRPGASASPWLGLSLAGLLGLQLGRFRRRAVRR